MEGDSKHRSSLVVSQQDTGHKLTNCRQMISEICQSLYLGWGHA